MNISAIVCVDEQNGIGKNGELLISIPDDMKYFRETTKDSIVVMGRKTLFSFKNNMPLPNRINIVWTNDDNIKNNYKDYDNIYFIKTINEMTNIINQHSDKKVFIIGGAKIYNNLIKLCDTVYVTKVYKTFDADTYFINLEKLGYKVTNKSEIFYYNDIKYQFLTYQK